ncbi:MAG TPA: ABC transporter substrate-binding protein [Polyangiaceae bacterium]|jgi:branched-chain amino acid transport system substrate-binding protein|nr:ABC transporter substrate-binding protein [Polyangiaceae bacterium]
MTLFPPRFLAFAAGALFALGACKKHEAAPTPGGSTAPAAERTGLVIGHYASLTGNTAHFGQDTDKAVRLAVEEVNAAGGVLGKPVKVTTLDDRGDSAEAASAVTRLLDVEHVNALIGEVASSLSLAGGRVAQRRGIPMVSPSSTNPKVTQVGDFIFRVCFIDPFQGKVMAVFAKDTLKLDNVAILKDVKNDYSIGLADTFKASFVAGGGKIAVEQSYSAGDTDFSAQVTAVKATKAQAIYVPGYYSEVGAIARTAQRLGVKIPLLGGDGWDAPELFKIGGDALEGSYFSNHFAPEGASPRGKAFIEAFKKKYGEEPTGLGMLGYDAAAVLFDATKRAGTTEPKALRDALAGTKDFDGVSGKITIDKDRNAEKSAVVIKITGGKGKYETTINP